MATLENIPLEELVNQYVTRIESAPDKKMRYREIVHLVGVLRTEVRGGKVIEGKLAETYNEYEREWITNKREKMKEARAKLLKRYPDIIRTKCGKFKAKLDLGPKSQKTLANDLNRTLGTSRWKFWKERITPDDLENTYLLDLTSTPEAESDALVYLMIHVVIPRWEDTGIEGINFRKGVGSKLGFQDSGGFLERETNIEGWCEMGGLPVMEEGIYSHVYKEALHEARHAEWELLYGSSVTNILDWGILNELNSLSFNGDIKYNPERVISDLIEFYIPYYNGEDMDLTLREKLEQQIRNSVKAVQRLETITDYDYSVIQQLLLDAPSLERFSRLNQVSDEELSMLVDKYRRGELRGIPF